MKIDHTKANMTELRVADTARLEVSKKKGSKNNQTTHHEATGASFFLARAMSDVVIDILWSTKDLDIELCTFQKGISIGRATAKHVTTTVK